MKKQAIARTDIPARNGPVSGKGIGAPIDEDPAGLESPDIRVINPTVRPIAEGTTFEYRIVYGTAFVAEAEAPPDHDPAKSAQK